MTVARERSAHYVFRTRFQGQRTLNGLVRLEVETSKQCDLLKIVDYAASAGYITSKVYLDQEGFAIFSSEPGLLVTKLGSEGDLEFKLYAQPNGSAFTLLTPIEKTHKSLADFVYLLMAGGCTEKDIVAASLSSNVALNKPLNEIGKVEGKFLGSMSIRGLVLYGSNAMLTLAPINDASENVALMYLVKGTWEDVKGRALVLDSLLEEAVEVVSAWISERLK